LLDAQILALNLRINLQLRPEEDWIC